MFFFSPVYENLPKMADLKKYSSFFPVPFRSGDLVIKTQNLHKAMTNASSLKKLQNNPKKTLHAI